MPTELLCNAQREARSASLLLLQAGTEPNQHVLEPNTRWLLPLESAKPQFVHPLSLQLSRCLAGSTVTFHVDQVLCIGSTIRHRKSSFLFLHMLAAEVYFSHALCHASHSQKSLSINPRQTLSFPFPSPSYISSCFTEDKTLPIKSDTPEC